MRNIVGLIAGVGLSVGTLGEASAQYQPGTPMGFSYTYTNYPTYGYAKPYSVPVYTYRRPNPTGYVNRPYYGAYGYGNYSNGSTDGFPPFRGRRGR